MPLTQIGLLQEELADVKRERNAFRQELSYYREKAAKYISLADEHNSTIRDLERELERTQKLAKMSEVLGDALKSSEASKKNEPIREGAIDVTHPSMNRQTSDFQNRLVSPGTQSSLQGTVDVTKEYPDAEIYIPDGSPEISLSSAPLTDQPGVDLKRSRIAQLQDHDDLPAKRLRTQRIQPLESIITVHETQNTTYEDRNTEEGEMIRRELPDDELHSSNYDIPLETTFQLSFEDTMSRSRRPSTSQATNVTLSPEISRPSHAATFQRPGSHAQEDVQPQHMVISARATQQNFSSSSVSLPERQETHPEPLQSDPASDKEPQTILLDIGRPRSSSDAPVLLRCSFSEISEFLRRRPFLIQPFPKWTKKCENVTSFSIRRLLGGLTGPGATFTETRNGRTHLFLQRENCPFLPVPGETSVVYVGFPNCVSPEVRVFIHRGAQKGDTMWEYAGDYKCTLKRLNPPDFKKESTRFREEFAQKLLFEQEFQSHYVTDPGPLNQPNKLMRDAELRAIDNGDKTVYIALVECYNYDYNFANDLVRKCTNLHMGLKYQSKYQNYHKE